PFYPHQGVTSLNITFTIIITEGVNEKPKTPVKSHLTQINDSK
ncbi:2078_t:CDS:1, partial [Funneliformis caledonium]